MVMEEISLEAANWMPTEPNACPRLSVMKRLEIIYFSCPLLILEVVDMLTK